ncbi:MAG: HD-GYP domain-containing protein [Armatimonadota bacterium]
MSDTSDNRVVGDLLAEMQAQHDAAVEELPQRRLGEAVVVALQRALKGAAFYDRGNSIYLQLVHDAHQTVLTLLAQFDPILLKVVRDALFLEKSVIRVTASSFPSYKALVKALRDRGIGAVTFFPGVSEAQLGEFLALLASFEVYPDREFDFVKQQLAARSITTIAVAKLDTADTELGYVDAEALKEKAKKVYFSTIHVIKDVMSTTKTGGTLDIRKAKRLMLNAVDLIIRDESTMLGLANIKSYDVSTFNHSVNVAIYAVALGHRIGLPKKYLNYLGVMGLFHDIGKTDISRYVLNKPGMLSRDEWALIQEHPVRGAEIVLKLKGWSELSARVITTAFEHHVKYDNSGYPLLSRRQPTLFSRIITLADCYDALGRPRVYRRVPYVSEKILGLLLERSGRDFDPVLVKIFINMIGVYPLGALVLLNTRDIGYITAINADPALLDRPCVCILRYLNGEYRKGEEVDLADKDEHGEYPHSIVETLDPNDYRIRVEEFLI